jgi:hypothetical protein
MASVLPYFSEELGRSLEVNPLEPPREKSTKEPPYAKVPAIEVFLNRVEKDLFDTTRSNYVTDNLTSEERKGGFPLGEIFRPNRNFLLSYKHSDGTKQKSFEFEQ